MFVSLLMISIFINAIKCEFSFMTNTNSCVSSDEKCFRKCCSPNYVIIGTKCGLNDSDFNPPVFSDKKPLTKFKLNVVSANFCAPHETRYKANGNFYLQENGELLLYDTTCKGRSLKWDQFCLEWRITPEFEKWEALTCDVALRQEDDTWKIGSMIISMPFLLVTFLVYAILPDRNLHQMALMFYVLSLLLSYLLLVTINLKSGLAPPLCEILGYSTLYCFMVSFFWMNVICFDIWFTFSGCRGFVGSKRSSERKKLALYSLYAFGVPLLVVVIVLVLDTFLPDCSIYKPGIGNEKCFLADGWPNLWYFYGEAGILVITNIVFFALTAWKIRQVKKETEMLKHNDSKRHNYEKDKQKFNLYVKLLFAMGANWSMEVISWLVNWQTDGSYSAIWYVPDFFNAIYGVFIFFIFVFKKKIWLLLKRRYYNFVGKPHLANTLTSANTRTSHYSSTNYSTADTNISSASTGRARQEEVALRGMST